MQQVVGLEPPTASQPLAEGSFAQLLGPLIEPGFRLALAMLHDAQAA